jgi:hypothetical protein
MDLDFLQARSIAVTRSKLSMTTNCQRRARRAKSLPLNPNTHYRNVTTRTFIELFQDRFVSIAEAAGHLTGQSCRGATGDHMAAWGESIRRGESQRC